MGVIRGIGLLLLAAMLLWFGATASSSGQESAPSAPELDALRDQFCGHPSPCVAINTLADPDVSEPASQPAPFYVTLQENGRPAAECPEAAAAYEASGHPVDVFIGPCPEIGGTGGSP